MIGPDLENQAAENEVAELDGEPEEAAKREAQFRERAASAREKAAVARSTPLKSAWLDLALHLEAIADALALLLRIETGSRTS